jgi:hypothetical protein
MLYQGDASALLKNLWPRVNRRSGRSRWSLVNLSVYLATNIMVLLITIYFNSHVIIDWMLYFRTNNDLHMIEPDFLQHLHTWQVQPLVQHPNLLMWKYQINLRRHSLYAETALHWAAHINNPTNKLMRNYFLVLGCDYIYIDLDLRYQEVSPVTFPI